MSVQTEITRIESAKTAISTAIEGKGVTVPEGTKLDGLAALVASIEAGGALPFEIKTGTFTFSENTTDAFSVQTDLDYSSSNKVLCAIFYETAYYSSAHPKLYFGMGIFTGVGKETTKNVLYGLTSGNYRKPMYDLSDTQLSLTKSIGGRYGKLTIKPDSSVPFRAGSVYRWILLGEG